MRPFCHRVVTPQPNSLSVKADDSDEKDDKASGTPDSKVNHKARGNADDKTVLFVGQTPSQVQHSTNRVDAISPL